MQKDFVTLVYLDGSKKEIPAKLALQLREAWALRRTEHITKDQLEFLDKVKCLQYTEEQAYCFHRYFKYKTIQMKHSKLYVMKCSQCTNIYQTDHDNTN